MVTTSIEGVLEGIKDQQRLADGYVVTVPHVELDWIELTPGRRFRALKWRLGTGRGTWKRVRPRGNLAYRFAGLHRASDGEILRFAKEYGILGICAEHADKEYPVDHWDGCLPISRMNPDPPPKFLGGFGEGLEPLKYWRRYARRVDAILEIGSALAQGQVGDRRLWKVLFPHSPHLLDLDGERRVSKLAMARYHFTRRAEEWYAVCGVRGVLDWRLEKTPGIGRWIFRQRPVLPFNLIGVIALDIVKCLCNGSQSLICSGCKREYVRSARVRRPRAGEANYCPECREAKIPQKDADERRRRRRDRVAALHAEGRTPQEIATILEMKLSTVERWVKKLSATSQN